MSSPFDIAAFIDQRIAELGKTTQEVATEASIDSPDVLSSIQAGTTQVPLDKVGRLTDALQADPVQLFKACLHQYCPDTWTAVSPFLEDTLTADEMVLVKAMRKAIDGPYRVSLSQQGRYCLNEFMAISCDSATVH